MAWAHVWNDGVASPIDRFAEHRGAPDARLCALTLYLEMAMPRRRSVPVRLWHGWSDHAIALYLMPDGALRVLHGDAVDVATTPGLLAPGHVLVLRAVFCAQGRHGVIDALNVNTSHRQRIHHSGALAPRIIDALPAEIGYVTMAGVAAIATHAVPPMDLPGLESGAKVETPNGPLPIEAIEPGMTVLSNEGAPQVVRWTEVRDRLCVGRSAPVLLRAPYFGLGADTCVTPETRLMRHGADVEYLAGTDTVLVRAADLVGGAAASFDRARAIRRFHHIMLDDPACLNVWRCQVETAFLSEVLASQDTGSASARPDPKDCAPSLPLLDRTTARALFDRGSGAQSFVA